MHVHVAADEDAPLQAPVVLVFQLGESVGGQVDHARVHIGEELRRLERDALTQCAKIAGSRWRPPNLVSRQPFLPYFSRGPSKDERPLRAF